MKTYGFETSVFRAAFRFVKVSICGLVPIEDQGWTTNMLAQVNIVRGNDSLVLVRDDFL